LGTLDILLTKCDRSLSVSWSFRYRTASLALACLLSLMFLLSFPANSRARESSVYLPGPLGQPASRSIEPSRFALWPSSSFYGDQLVWQSWGDEEGHAQGLFHLRDYQSRREVAIRGRLRLASVVACSGAMYFSYYRIVLSHRGPAGFKVIDGTTNPPCYDLASSRPCGRVRVRYRERGSRQLIEASSIQARAMSCAAGRTLARAYARRTYRHVGGRAVRNRFPSGLRGYRCDAARLGSDIRSVQCHKRSSVLAFSWYDSSPFH
jgi:hypothetical protein